MAVETEIKFSVHDLGELERKLRAAGFTLQTPRTFESNVLYDTPQRTLRMRTEILRIRRYGETCTVTHKRLPASGTGEDRHKHRIETETRIDNAAAREEIFAALGLVPAFRYEKWRTEWTDGTGHCVVDETPIGNYAELEGTSSWIDQPAAKLGVSDEQYSTLSYGRLFEQWKQETGSRAEHLTFGDVRKMDNPANIHKPE
jgi:adenylate cyclase class 2